MRTLLVFAPVAFAAVTQEMQLRLLTPLASYSKPGTPFEAVVTGPAADTERGIVPRGTLIRGVVRRAHTVKFGVRRERASLELSFEACQTPNGEPLACELKLVAVDNARETVREGNRIRGILAANHAQSLLNGVWLRPAPRLIRRPVSGLYGAAGMVYRLAPNPIGMGSVITARLLLLRLPDSEIELPTGAGLIARMSVEPPAAIETHSAPLTDPLEVDLADWLRAAPVEIFRPDGAREADVINLAFLATREQLEQTFAAAGWVTADEMSSKTRARSYRSVTKMTAYARAPVSPLLYQKRPPDLVFQKSLNTISKRHHIRIWRAEEAGVDLWLAAATHDTSIVFDWSRMSITHRIDPYLDKERATVVNDLVATGCATRVTNIDRPHRARKQSTDGALMAIDLKHCDTKAPEIRYVARPKKNLATAGVRRVVLETRHYFWRANAYHWGFRGAASVRKAFRK